MPLLLRLIALSVLCSAVTIPAAVLAQDMPLKKSPQSALAPEPVHSVKKAAIFSAVLPGLGQAYNKKYWKIPIIYAGFGAFGYFAVKNNNEYKMFKEAYLYVANSDTTPINNPYVIKYTPTQLKEAMDYYRRNRDLSLILAGLWYTLNVLEAYVDAHFFDYDISDDLSMHIGPSAIGVPFAAKQPVAGIKISLKF